MNRRGVEIATGFLVVAVAVALPAVAADVEAVRAAALREAVVKMQVLGRTYGACERFLPPGQMAAYREEISTVRAIPEMDLLRQAQAAGFSQGQGIASDPRVTPETCADALEQAKSEAATVLRAAARAVGANAAALERKARRKR